MIHGPTVIGDYTIVDERATIDRSVIWQNCYIGEGADLHEALIGKQCSLKAGTVFFEGTVAEDNCTIGEGAIVRSNVKLWPTRRSTPGQRSARASSGATRPGARSLRERGCLGWPTWK